MKIVHFSFKAVKRVASIVVSVPLHVIYYFSKYVPRNNSRWVFSSWKGMAARGNSKYLIEYVNSKCGDVEVVWVTKNKEFGIDGLSSSVNAVYGYSFAGVWHLLTAGVVFVSHGLNDVVPYFTRGAVIVNLGHTTFSIKKMSFHEKINNMGLVYKLYS